MRLLFGLLIASTMLFACKSTKDAVKNTEHPSYILFGNGGGFTGKTTTYQLAKSGQIKKQSGIKSAFNSHSTVESAVCTQIFESIDKLELKDKSLNDPGNLTYFIEIHQDGTVHRLAWGGTSQEPDSAVRGFYNLMHGLATRQVIAKE